MENPTNDPTIQPTSDENKIEFIGAQFLGTDKFNFAKIAKNAILQVPESIYNQYGDKEIRRICDAPTAVIEIVKGK